MTNDPNYRPGGEKPLENQPPDDPALNRRAYRERPGGTYALPALLGILIIFGLIFWYGGWGHRVTTASNETAGGPTTQQVNPPSGQPGAQPPGAQAPATNQ